MIIISDNLKQTRFWKTKKENGNIATIDFIWDKQKRGRPNQKFKLWHVDGGKTLNNVVI